MGLEGRAAWGLEAPEGLPELRLLSWAVGAAPCGHWRVLFGCTLVQVDWLTRDAFSSRKDVPGGPAPRLGLGLRAGVEFVARERFSMRAWGDAVVSWSGQRVRTNDELRWPGSVLRGALGVGALVMF